MLFLAEGPQTFLLFAKPRCTLLGQLGAVATEQVEDGIEEGTLFERSGHYIRYARDGREVVGKEIFVRNLDTEFSI